VDTHTKHKDSPQPPVGVAADELAANLSLMLMYLSSWKERPDDALRFWKGFSFDVLNQLAEQGLIQDSRRAKSAYLTAEGIQRARELLTRYGAADPQETDRNSEPSPLG
jgi:hypothetical protein